MKHARCLVCIDHCILRTGRVYKKPQPAVIAKEAEYIAIGGSPAAGTAELATAAAAAKGKMPRGAGVGKTENKAKSASQRKRDMDELTAKVVRNSSHSITKHNYVASILLLFCFLMQIAHVHNCVSRVSCCRYWPEFNTSMALGTNTIMPMNFTNTSSSHRSDIECELQAAVARFTRPDLPALAC